MRRTNTQIGVRVDAAFKAEVEAVFGAMGLKPSEAIRMFLQQTVNRGALPFVPTAPHLNEITVRAMEEPNKSLKKFDSVDDLWADLED